MEENGDVDFSPKITIFEKITKITVFLALFFRNRPEKKIKILKVAFKILK